MPDPTPSQPAPKVVVDTRRSPHATLQPVPLDAVTLTDAFWAPRLERNAEAAIPRLFQLLEAHGVLDNFRRLYGMHPGPRRGYLFTDSDLYKWMEAAAWVLARGNHPPVAALLDTAIAAILPAQQEDGYLNTYYTGEHPGEPAGNNAPQRWTDLANGHELYCAGHLIQAAIAHQRATGETRLLDAARRFADHIVRRFLPAAGKAGPAQPAYTPGHPEIEMALVELYRLTGENSYLDLATYFLAGRGLGTRFQIHGHAVRALYYIAGACDLYLERGDPQVLAVLESQWQDLVGRKIYLTGGAGGRYRGEAFGAAYELPNQRAYAETCAAIAAIFWHWRLLQLEGQARFADWLERTLYNGFLSGVSLSGTEYFYMNPLADTGLGEDDPWAAWARRGVYRRREWYDCTCCPPNVQRLLASLPGYFYSTSEHGLWVHLFAASRLTTTLADGTPITLQQVTDYPWEGKIQLRVIPETESEFSLFVRIPGWARRATVRVDGEPLPGATPGSYLEIHRTWRREALVELELEMPVERMLSDERLAGNRGQVAIQRGPLVYCLEGVDHGGEQVSELQIRPQAGFSTQHQAGLLGGVTVIAASGVRFTPAANAPLYAPAGQRPAGEWQDVPLNFIPYYAWANRAPGSLAVWIPVFNPQQI